MVNTETISPWFSQFWIQIAAVIATAAGILSAILLLIGWKTEFFAKLNGILMILFALTMSFSGNIKTAIDASVFATSAPAVALGTMKVKFLKMDGKGLSRFLEIEDVIIIRK